MDVYRLPVHLRNFYYKQLSDAKKKEQEDMKKTSKIDVWVKEIKGINYYVDSANNVYMPGDILSNLPNPRKIGKYELLPSGAYHIPGLDSYVS